MLGPGQDRPGPDCFAVLTRSCPGPGPRSSSMAEFRRTGEDRQDRSRTGPTRPQNIPVYSTLATQWHHISMQNSPADLKIDVFSCFRASETATAWALASAYTVVVCLYLHFRFDMVRKHKTRPVLTFNSATHHKICTYIYYMASCT